MPVLALEGREWRCREGKNVVRRQTRGSPRVVWHLSHGARFLKVADCGKGLLQRLREVWKVWFPPERDCSETWARKTSATRKREYLPEAGVPPPREAAKPPRGSLPSAGPASDHARGTGTHCEHIRRVSLPSSRTEFSGGPRRAAAPRARPVSVRGLLRPRTSVRVRASARPCEEPRPRPESGRLAFPLLLARSRAPGTGLPTGRFRAARGSLRPRRMYRHCP